MVTRLITGATVALLLAAPIAAHAQTVDPQTRTAPRESGNSEVGSPPSGGSAPSAPADTRQDSNQNRSPYGSYYRIETPWQNQPIKPAWQR